MKKQTLMKKVILLFAAIALIYSCNKSVTIEPETETEPETEEVLSDIPLEGKWKLMERHFVSAIPDFPPRPSVDCSKFNIIFEFKTDSVLIVSGDKDYFIDWSKEYAVVFLAEGTHSYFIKGQETANWFYLSIDDVVYHYRIISKDKRMSMGLMAKGTLYLERIEE